MDIQLNKSGIPFDIDALITDVNGKADVDLTNVNDVGTSKCASWAMPSTSFEDRVIGASNIMYTAPANGWFNASGYASDDTNTSYIFLVNSDCRLSAENISNISGAGLNINIEVQKGHQVRFDYLNMKTDTLALRFIYAEGSKSEAR